MPTEVLKLELDQQPPPSPECGRRLPPVLLDQTAAEDPERILYSIAKSNQMQDGFQDLTYKTVANAVNRCASWLKSTLGTDKPRVFCYLGPLDLRYIILVLAAPKAGHTVRNLFSNQDSTDKNCEGLLHLPSKQSRSSFISG
jgi:acyl-CoA synthetase (AMP-forming)/AMP-acid ligase II